MKWNIYFTYWDWIIWTLIIFSCILMSGMGFEPTIWSFMLLENHGCVQNSKAQISKLILPMRRSTDLCLFILIIQINKLKIAINVFLSRIFCLSFVCSYILTNALFWFLFKFRMLYLDCIAQIFSELATLGAYICILISSAQSYNDDSVSMYF